jgi:hypothetical protein
VLSVFRQHYYAAKFFPEDPLVSQEDDILEIATLKVSNGPVGKVVNYLYDGSCFRLYPIPEDYVPQTVSALRRAQADESGESEDDDEI